MRRCSLHILQCGYCRQCEALSIRGGALRPIVFPALVGLIVHPDVGPVLFDTGYDPSFFHATQPFPERLYRWTTPPVIRLEDTVSAQLSRFGLTPDDIRLVIVSHFHADHVAGLRQFPAARLLCARAGLDDLRSRRRFNRVRHGILETLIPTDFRCRASFAEDCSLVSLTGDLSPFAEAWDLLGDGSLLGLDLPGHAAGQLGLALHDENGRFQVLAADAAWSCRAIREDSSPPAFITRMFSDTVAYRETLHRLHLLGRRNPEVVFTPSHCRERSPS